MERKGKSPAKTGEGGKEGVAAEEANLGLHVREKVDTTLNDRPSALSEPFWSVQIGEAPSASCLISCHSAPSLINAQHLICSQATISTLRLLLSVCPATGFSW